VAPIVWKRVQDRKTGPIPRHDVVRDIIIGLRNSGEERLFVSSLFGR